MILKICLFLLKSCNACLFSTSSRPTFQVNSDLLLYSHAMELSFRSFMCMVDAEIVEITATDFIRFSLRQLCCRSEYRETDFTSAKASAIADCRSELRGLLEKKKIPSFYV